MKGCGCILHAPLIEIEGEWECPRCTKACACGKDCRGGFDIKQVDADPADSIRLFTGYPT